MILNYGVVTPFVQFNFKTGCIEADIKPKYFVNLEHNRTCKKACTFKLTVVYVPDTFREGRPTDIDNMLITSKNEKVTYQYGYYTWAGTRVIQYRTYVGQFNKYTCDVDVASGTLTYVIEGNAVAVELLNKQVSLETDLFNKLRMLPSQVVELCSNPDGTVANAYIYKQPYYAGGIAAGTIIGAGSTANANYAFSDNDYSLMGQRPFADIGNYYERNISHTDEFTELPRYECQGMLDIILGTAQGAKDGDNKDKETNIDKKGGIVQHSKVKIASIDDAVAAGIWTEEERSAYNVAKDVYGSSSKAYLATEADKAYQITTYTNLMNKLFSPFMAFFDDSYTMSSKYGTFHYIPKRGMASNTFNYYYGNNQKESDVISMNFSYDGSVAMANAAASSSISAFIDADGNNIGQTNSTTNVLSLGRNTYPTLSGFREDRFLSQKELTECLIYPMTASMTILGQIEPNDLLQVIEINVFINGKKHPSLSGEYSITSIVDNLSSNGFTTTFELIRAEFANTIEYEAFVANRKGGNADIVQTNIDNATLNS